MEHQHDSTFSGVVEFINRARMGKPLPFGPILFDPWPPKSLANVNKRDLQTILFRLRHDERVIDWKSPEEMGIRNLRVRVPGTKASPALPKDGLTALTRPMNHPVFSRPHHPFTILKSFDEWYASWKVRQDREFRLLSDLNFQKVLITSLDLESKLQTCPFNKIILSLDLGHTSPLIESTAGTGLFRLEALDYLRARGVVISYSRGQEGKGGFLGVDLDLGAFNSFLEDIRKVRSMRLRSGFSKKQNSRSSAKKSEMTPEVKEETQPDSSKIIYEIRYTPSREVLLNKVLLAKVEFNSENDNVFGFLFKNPNRTITIEEVSKSLGKKAPLKGLRKIVENLGFRGERHSAFFSVSKTSILFRNPLRRSELEAMGKTWLRLFRK